MKASRSLEWKQAMIDEFNALLRHGIWFLVPDSPNFNTVGWKCIFKVKPHFDGSIESHKAYLVVKRLHQQPGITISIPLVLL